MDNFALLLCVLNVILLCTASDIVEIRRNPRVFEIDWKNNQFLKDGEAFRFIAGSIHYFRHPRAYWADRLRKLRAAGFNAVTTYIEWSLHEPSQGVYEFTGEKDFVHFIKLAEAEGLLVILRPGPYICAERDFGGYPSWILTESPDVKLRTNDTSHTRYVNQWLKHLFPLIQPLLYGNGGPIIMVQVENEYGSYSIHDIKYTTWLRDVFLSYIGDKAVLFTTDGFSENFLKNGLIPSVFITVDFGSGGDVQGSFIPLRKYQKQGPLVNSEFYAGWLTHWGEPLQGARTETVVTTMRDLLELNVSINMFMFAGGTNFGFTSGANYGKYPIEPQITSYDYDAPLNEAGDPTEKYYTIRELVSKYTRLPDLPVPQPADKGDYGSVKMHPIVSIFDAPSPKLPVRAKYPLSFEALGQRYGFILYETKVPQHINDKTVLYVNELHDRALIYLDKTFAGILSRSQNINRIELLARPGQTLSLLVENQGRINYGDFKDFKGILSNVKFDNDTTAEDWVHTGYPLGDISQIEGLPKHDGNIRPPAFYTAKFQLPKNMTTPLDTFVDLRGWGKGVLFVNQFNLGRYWVTLGPQITLYLPGCYLRPYPAQNEITIFELEFVNPKNTVTFITEPILNVTYAPY